MGGVSVASSDIEKIRSTGFNICIIYKLDIQAGVVSFVQILIILDDFRGFTMGIKNSKAVDGIFDVAVVIATIVRPSLLKAIGSVIKQSFKGKIQILVGVDKLLGDPEILEHIFENIPDNITLTLVDQGYSTSVRHNGIHTARDGGALRSILSFMANSQYVAYLDDDNYWGPNHLEYLLKAVEGVDWSFSLRWLVDEHTGKKLTVDKWHSVGPGKGNMTDTSGGFSDPNTLLIDKLACADQLHLWSKGSDQFLAPGDRNFCNGLILNKTWRASNQATTYYHIRRSNVLWENFRVETVNRLITQLQLRSVN